MFNMDSFTEVDQARDLAKVFDTVELSSDPDLRRRGTFVTVDHPVRGKFVMPGFIVKMSQSHVPVTASPMLAAHNEAVYGGLLGLSTERLAELRDNGVI